MTEYIELLHDEKCFFFIEKKTFHLKLRFWTNKGTNNKGIKEQPDKLILNFFIILDNHVSSTSIISSSYLI